MPKILKGLVVLNSVLLVWNLLAVTGRAQRPPPPKSQPGWNAILAGEHQSDGRPADGEHQPARCCAQSGGDANSGGGEDPRDHPPTRHPGDAFGMRCRSQLPNRSRPVDRGSAGGDVSQPAAGVDPGNAVRRFVRKPTADVIEHDATGHRHLPSLRPATHIRYGCDVLGVPAKLVRN